MASLRDTVINGSLTINGGGQISDSPTSNTDIVNKGYVDSIVTELTSSKLKVGPLYISCGSIITEGQGASKTSALITTLSSINNLFGITGSSSGNTAVFASNGDGNHSSVHVEGCTLQNSSWLATFNSSLSGTIRLNYVILRWAV